MSYRLIAIDIDGTLLNDHKEVTEGNRTAIAAAMNRGIYVTLCTGRGVLTASRIKYEVPDLNAPLILNGGALISDIPRGRFLYVRNLPQCVAVDAVNQLRDVACFPLVYAPLPESQYFYYDRMDPANEAFREYVDKNPGRAHRVEDVLATISADPAMVATTDRVERIRDLEPMFKSRMPETTVTLEVSPIDRQYCHVTLTPRGVSKGTGLRELASILGIDMSETLAIGDNLNDLDMLTSAGLGVAMGNATPEAKERADHITASNNEDGVARVIEQFAI